jgi:ABC-type antimicrobial peptide transport system permease subunit
VLKSSYRLAFVLGLVGILGGLGFFLLTHHSIFAAIATSEPRAKAVCQKRLTKLAPATPC